MIRPIMKDEAFLAQPSAPATQEDLPVAHDLLDTLAAHREGCVGMAANMIGVRKRIIAFDDEGGYTVMLNPEIVRRADRYEAEEGCLSLTGVRRVQRWRSIKVRYQNMAFQTRLKTFTGWTAQIIQHELDHCDGVLI
ncbi:MAG: peptide deformylase [Agathobaculum sp.]|uniref:peptide deformylase n=1 Tax=Agathobaculum sp. TaxID=2048138 RepID=UPI0025C455AC|nr:peptide deformylase [Agathobaculum sp.]MCI7126513.1 peptide deformylase [Agathobaculum sp.]MDY3711807.1 peptide deformylase [Agathobaculum sp.]